MSQYKPYPAYKESSIEWSKKIPEGWNVKPLFAAANERNEPNKGMQEDNLLSLSYGFIVRKDINTNEGLLPESFETYQIVRKGDIVFRLTDLQNDKRSLRTAIVRETGIITSAYVAVEPTGVVPEYLNHLLRAYDIQKVFYSMGGGMRQSMKFEDLRRLPIMLPSPKEQMEIAEQLDRETARTDALIEKKTRFIELLREKRQALITHAVTKGHNPNAKMKDSGVEWLGEVPKNWDCCLFKYKCLKVTDGAHISPETENGIHYFVSTKDIVGSSINFDAALLTSAESYAYLIKTGCNPADGDVLFSKDGTIGRTVVVRNTPDFVVASSLIIIRPDRSKLEPDYLNYFFQSKVVISQVESLVRGAGLPRISIQNLLKIVGAFPSVSDQSHIAKFLDRETSRIDVLIDKTDKSIALLKERRSALITAAVTGQIDLREAS